MYRTEFWTLWEKVRVGCFERTASKHVYYLGWNRSPAQAGCMRQVLGPGALGRPRGVRSRGRWEGGSGWGVHVNPWLTHVNVWQNPLQYCKVISLQLIKKKKKKKQWIVNLRRGWDILCLKAGRNKDIKATLKFISQHIGIMNKIERQKENRIYYFQCSILSRNVLPES